MLRTAAVAVLLPVGMGVAAAASNRPGAINPDGRKALEAAVGSGFRLVSPDGVVTATLSEVRDLMHAAAGDPEAFSAVFRLDGDATTAVGTGLVDVDGPGTQWRDVGLIIDGEPGRRTAVLVVDRRPVSVHLAHAASL
ncbi:hypothetical protein GCM10025789_06440 [Tessaracoccus lubricantis]|uniref:Uncharacterized protein n=1 Tax=Tessaracoccus lubricantis TaxID=545543 RepID=A0ABP9F516_9ACTN